MLLRSFNTREQRENIYERHVHDLCHSWPLSFIAGKNGRRDHILAAFRWHSPASCLWCIKSGILGLRRLERFKGREYKVSKRDDACGQGRNHGETRLRRANLVQFVGTVINELNLSPSAYKLGSIELLTPSGPVRANSNRFCETHRSEANLSLD